MPPEYEALLRNRESERLSAEFDSALAELVEAWQRVSSDTSTAAFKTWRDKVIAHSELHHKDGTYTPIDLAVLGLKWGDLGLLIEEVQRVIAGIGSVVRSAGFAWSILDEQLNDASTSFWAALAAAPRRAV